MNTGILLGLRIRVWVGFGGDLQVCNGTKG